MIDLIFCSDPTMISNFAAIPCSLSEHHLVYCELYVRMANPSAKIMTVRSFFKCDRNELLKDLHETPWWMVEAFDAPDEALQCWEGLFLEVLNRHAPIKNVRVRAKTLSLIDEHIRDLMMLSYRLHKRALKVKSREAWEEYKTIRNFTTKELRR